MYSYSISPCVLHALSISISFIWLYNSIWQRILIMKLLILQLFPAFYHFTLLVQMLSSGSCSQTPSICVLWDTKFHVHTKRGEIISILISCFLSLCL
jgi:hypothetical protein